MTDNEIINIISLPMYQQLAVAVDKYGKFIRVKDLLDLINRQKAEINELTEGLESLNDEIERLKEYKKYQPVGCPNCRRGNFSNDKFCSHCGYPLKKQSQGRGKQAELERYKGVIKILENDVKTAKAEAIKEFAERWHNRLARNRAELEYQPELVRAAFDIAIATTDGVVEEMTE